MTIHLDGPARVEFNGQDLTPYLADQPQVAEDAATDILDRIDNTIGGLCPCGATPRAGSPYCSSDCEPTHSTAHTGYSAMRCRPDLVTAHDDADLIEVDVIRAAETVATREGRHNARIYQRASDPTVWHLRLDDGHRYVGCDLADMGVDSETISTEQTVRIHDAWRRLERELTDTRRTVADAYLYASRWAPLSATGWRRLCQACGQHGIPRHGRRPVHTGRPAALLTDPAPFMRDIEDCQLCEHCREPFPGPPLHLQIAHDRLRDVYQFRMSADGYGSAEHCINAENLFTADDPWAAAQSNLDRMERELLTPPNVTEQRQQAFRNQLAYYRAATLVVDPSSASILRNITAT